MSAYKIQTPGNYSEESIQNINPVIMVNYLMGLQVTTFLKTLTLKYVI